MCPLHLFLFGSPRLEKDGQVIPITRRKSLALLAYLGVNPLPHSRDSLAGFFWPEYDQSAARSNLRRTLVSLRKQKGDVCLEIQRESIQILGTSDLRIDVLTFKELIRQWREHSHYTNPCPECLATLEQAAAIYSEDFLTGFSLLDCPAFDDWQLLQRESLQRDLAAALQELSDGYGQFGEYNLALTHAHRWLSLDPLHEPARRMLMRLYAWSGDRSAALRQYEDCDKVLGDELGIQPAEETHALYKAILNQEEAAKPCKPLHKVDLQQRYHLQEELGRGGMSVVYRAHDILLERDVAVKLLDPSRLSTEGQARLLKEARAIARLNHPNIRAVYDIGEVEGAPYLVMELVEGQTLREKADALLEDKLHWMVQVCSALEHAHQNGILHHDLKPENVFINADGWVHLADFGLARQLEASQLTPTGMLVGTPAYVAPEQLRGEEIDERSDLYALGVLLYEIAAGRQPFEGCSLVEIISQHLNVIPTPPRQYNPAISPMLEELILELLRKQPNERPDSAQSVRQSLETILEQKHVPALATGIARTRHNLPIQSIPFVGREDLLEEIRRKMEDPTCRLLNLVGPGGCGKTRLALEAGKRQLDHYTNGVFFVSLEPLSSADAIVPAIAEAMGFSFYKPKMSEEPKEPKQQLFNYLARKCVLLILDNYEHLLDGAGIVSEIIHTSPQSMIMATSRARLGLFEEQTVYIPGMQLPSAEEQGTEDLGVKNALRFNAVMLFVQAAHWAQPGFELDSGNLEDVVHICRLVDGMPLGILLAAAWVKLFSPDKIAAEIEKGLDFLKGDLRGLPDRQRSLQAVFDRSWGMLSPREQAVFAALSVFRGGCTWEAVQQATGSNPHQFLALLNHSFLQREASGRFTLHRLLHQYAAEQLAKEPHAQQVARERHCTYFANRLAAWERDLKGARQGMAIAEMDIEIENCHAAWDTAAAKKNVAELQKMQESLYLYYIFRLRYREGELIFRTAAERLAKVSSSQALKLRAILLARQADLLGYYAPGEQVEQMFQQSEKILDDALLADHDIRRERADLLRYKAINLEGISREEAENLLKQSLGLYRTLGDKWAEAQTLYGMGNIHYMTGNTEQAMRYFEESEHLFEELGDASGMGQALINLGSYIVVIGQLERGEALQRKAIAALRRTNDPSSLQRALLCLGYYVFSLSKGQFLEAQVFIDESLRICREAGMVPSMITSKNTFCSLEINLGNYQAADDLCQSSLALAKEIEFPRGIARALDYLSCIKMTEGDYGQACSLSQESVVLFRRSNLPPHDLVDALATLGTVTCLIGELSRSKQLLCETLDIVLKLDILLGLLRPIPAVCLLLASKGEIEKAVEIYHMAKTQFPYIARSKFMDDIIGKRIRTAAASLPPEVIASAEARGSAHDPWQTTRELLAELEAMA